jgi:carbon storage regulator
VELAYLRKDPAPILSWSENCTNAADDREAAFLTVESGLTRSRADRVGRPKTKSKGAGLSITEDTAMLVLSRKVGEKICIAGNIEITICEIHGDRVRLGIHAPPEVSIHRQEVAERLQRETALNKPRFTQRDLVPLGNPLCAARGG